MREQSYLSLEYFEAEITATSSDGTAIPAASLAVEFAWASVGAEPADADWQATIHLRDDVFGVLVGPGALQLPRADYDVWRRITDNPERPAAPFAKHRIF